MERRSLVKLLSLLAGDRFCSALTPTGARGGFAAAGTTPAAPQVVQAQTGGVPRLSLNQVGYLPDQAKIATLAGVDAGGAFAVRSLGSDAIVLSGVLSAAQQDAASGDVVVLADLSALRAPGRYMLETMGHKSDPFTVAADVYAAPLRLTTRAFYGQRCGCAVDLGGGYSHAACHVFGEYHASSGRSGRVSNAGGWHDAGDYGRYVVNSGITCGTLLWAWEMYPGALRKLELELPRTRPHLPEFLAEVLWNLEWMLSLQDADGGVFHKQTSEHFCGFVMPERDTLPSEIIGTGAAPFKSTGATADFAAVMAIAARCYGELDRDMARRFLDASRRAWVWASAHQDVAFRNPPGISTGEYGDKELYDEWLWATAELWRTTGDAAYEKALLSAPGFRAGQISIEPPSWGSVAPLAYWTYALADRKKHEGVADEIREATRKTAATLIERSRQNGYGNTMALTDYHWGSNGDAANQSLLLAVSHRMQPDTQAITAALGNLHYLLGRNCHGVSWVTHLGARPFQHPHHRPSAADGVAEPWPGLLSGGPNAHPADAAAAALPKLPPMRMWIDDERAYSLNEVAINWNAPLVFLLAFAQSV